MRDHGVSLLVSVTPPKETSGEFQAVFVVTKPCFCTEDVKAVSEDQNRYFKPKHTIF